MRSLAIVALIGAVGFQFLEAPSPDPVPGPFTIATSTPPPSYTPANPAQPFNGYGQ